jgi:hypothetical protein
VWRLEFKAEDGEDGLTEMQAALRKLGEMQIQGS